MQSCTFFLLFGGGHEQCIYPLFKTAHTQKCTYTFFSRKSAHTHSMCMCVCAHEAFRQVDYALQNSRRGTPPARRGSLTLSSSELSEAICICPKRKFFRMILLICRFFLWGVGCYKPLENIRL